METERRRVDWGRWALLVAVAQLAVDLAGTVAR